MWKTKCYRSLHLSFSMKISDDWRNKTTNLLILIFQSISFYDIKAKINHTLSCSRSFLSIFRCFVQIDFPVVREIQRFSVFQIEIRTMVFDNEILREKLIEAWKLRSDDTNFSASLSPLIAECRSEDEFRTLFTSKAILFLGFERLKKKLT